MMEEEKKDVVMEEKEDKEKLEELKKDDEVAIEPSQPLSHRPPRIRNKSQSMPEQEHIISSPSAQIPAVISTGSKHQPSPLLSRRQSAPPITPPGGSSPSVSRKKLVFAQRPLSKYIYYLEECAHAKIFTVMLSQ